MEGIKIIAFVSILCGFQFSIAQNEECALESHLQGQIVSTVLGGGENCWAIPVPTGHLVSLQFNNFQLKNPCDKENVRISVTGQHEYQFCLPEDVDRPIKAFSNVTVIHFVRYAGISSTVSITYKVGYNECLNPNSFKCYDYSCIPQEKVGDGVKDCRYGEDEFACENMECLQNSSFKCDDDSCIPEENVCDGANDCKDGEDEIGCGNIECLKINSFKCNDDSCVPQEKICDNVKDCKKGEDEIGCVTSVDGVFKARHKALYWLKKRRTAAWGWRENTPRAIVAHYLGSAVNFNGSIPDEATMAKQTEFKTAVALLRPSLPNTELSMLINALLVTCHNPRQFYGNNLVKRLREQVEESKNNTHPLAYLTLCNAKEPWLQKATIDLIKILRINSEHPFVKDLQAMAVMALSCEWNRKTLKRDEVHSNTIKLYNETIQHFKKLQTHDGSFGNVHTTALIMQALFSSGQQLSKDYKLDAAIKYLMKELDSSSVDFLATYFALPVLNGKSFIDIAQVNCSSNPREHGDDPISDPGPKMRIQYSLYIGEEKDTVHSISLRVPINYTALEVMKSAKDENTKFKFEWKMTSGKMYVYHIANLTNDLEAEKFWLLYVGAANCSETLTPLTKGPEEIIMSDGEHLVFWYKKATFDYAVDE